MRAKEGRGFIIVSPHWQQRIVVALLCRSRTEPHSVQLMTLSKPASRWGVAGASCGVRVTRMLPQNQRRKFCIGSTSNRALTMVMPGNHSAELSAALPQFVERSTPLDPAIDEKYQPVAYANRAEAVGNNNESFLFP